MDELGAVGAGDQQADLVALEPAGLRGRAGLVGGREREGERLADTGGRAHAGASISAPAA
jgi:hypothetical protein